ncbi:Hsp70 family protein [Chelatococcus sp. SYSU_G07232]|uniref:Hsp70 family protein n=1 Tax=Chelatococcus albus TaxID=3047466 RepID=A0ABT7AD07_9HYPH|nr:Hsp70 family protein [Chelatococcus sp. SYSU_G07232]MDJ1157259.1 Hsp70 family protein [Chelatococcus sp. SYSU_G07232]
MMFCGLDFGTSNTTLGIATGDGLALARLEGPETTLPSAVFFAAGSHEVLTGRAAMAAYLDGVDGRLLRSLKSVLGTALIDESTQVGRRRISFRDVIATFLHEAKRRAEAESGRELTAVVMGRPVHFVTDDEEANRRAEDALAAVARSVGFRDVLFQFEPVAAALEYERGLAREEIAIVADIGGGTSDFSVIRLGPEHAQRHDRQADVLANEGARVGGTDFDRDLSLLAVMPLLGYRSAMQKKGLDVPSWYYLELATWSRVNFLYASKVLRELQEVRRQAARPDLIERLARVIETRQGHTLLMTVEQAKIALTEDMSTRLALGAIEDGLAAAVERREFAEATDRLAATIAERIRRCLSQAGLAAADIDVVFLTGGSTCLPHVRGRILAELPAARVVDGDRFGAVGLGLTVEAARRFA